MRSVFIKVNRSVVSIYFDRRFSFQEGLDSLFSFPWILISVTVVYKTYVFIKYIITNRTENMLLYVMYL